MKISQTYSFKGGEKFIKTHHKKELKDIATAINNLNAIACLTKESSEKTMRGKLLFSPAEMNDRLKSHLFTKGWTEKPSKSSKKAYREPRHYFGKGRYREMDGIKNLVGLEIQFGKYAFMGYDIFGKMIIFKNLGKIQCGIEIVPMANLQKQMSTGVSAFEQIMIDFQYRGESNIDIPVYVIGLDLTEEEQQETNNLRKLFKTNKTEALKKITLRTYRGAPPGPK